MMTSHQLHGAAKLDQSPSRGSITFSNELCERLFNADRVAVLTGAGISAESGVPTFRDADGYWSKFSPQQLATEDAFRADPALVQRWYRERLIQSKTVAPNPGHVALAKLELLVPEFCLITQNVDNLHTMAGSSNVVELHGNVASNYCIDCSRKPQRLLDEVEELPHKCEHCGGFVRPGVVWFGEMMPQQQLAQAVEATERCDVFMSIGTSAVVYPAASLPSVAKSAGALTVEINIEPSAVANVIDECLIGKAGELLPDLISTVFNLAEGR